MALVIPDPGATPGWGRSCYRVPTLKAGRLHPIRRLLRHKKNEGKGREGERNRVRRGGFERQLSGQPLWSRLLP